MATISLITDHLPCSRPDLSARNSAGRSVSMTALLLVTSGRVWEPQCCQPGLLRRIYTHLMLVIDTSRGGGLLARCKWFPTWITCQFSVDQSSTWPTFTRRLQSLAWLQTIKIWAPVHYREDYYSWADTFKNFLTFPLFYLSQVKKPKKSKSFTTFHWCRATVG